MELPKDPVMLLSVINTELRDKYPSLDALCEDREITKTSITDTLKGIDYESVSYTHLTLPTNSRV